MDIAVIVVQTAAGKFIPVEASDKITALQPRFDDIRKSGRMGKEIAKKVMLMSTWTGLETRDCTPAVKA